MSCVCDRFCNGGLVRLRKAMVFIVDFKRDCSFEMKSKAGFMVLILNICRIIFHKAYIMPMWITVYI